MAQQSDQSTPLQLTPELVRRVARLARLSVPEAELPGVAEDLARVLHYADRLAALDLASVAPLATPLERPITLRGDAPGPVMSPDLVLAIAPACFEGFISVPPVLVGGGEGDGGGGA
ncbi:MAG: Asp-tRNA(Asn)/Glu-tRNA(Gln) amidotransferase GatCAB subunit C [Planctomyces sp.]|nr:Asp-tRNA(Asn)/Glu-tRNA(Gln) amidotransferase GatCAB subunit C [Planctomyces sp.]MBA4038727.1 Asp-tRNA(Asn)/Glu-tRNA(Gln) amidotransferase GatCAB subunit C [Planctomyces sp.]MBA4119334.1 Asp-tRNA(Asn)/Glu-tRNA(Gln) amidotransferase GatCAB subunit C [Isosphaera sp.]